MGLTSSSVGTNAIDAGLKIKKEHESDKIVALAGNPNVGKSTVFNALTGMNQHTGNWPGKTVTNARGIYHKNGKNYIMIDIPGTYSLTAHSCEEEVASDFLCFGNADAVIVVCDATCLERSLSLVLQTAEITDNIVVCVNLMDEAKHKKISIDLKLLSKKLGVPVIGTSARRRLGLDSLADAVDNVTEVHTAAAAINYIKPVESAIAAIEKSLPHETKIKKRLIALKLLQQRDILKLSAFTGIDFSSDNIKNAIKNAKKILGDNDISDERLSDIITSCTVLTAEDICNGVVKYENSGYNVRDRKIDRFLTGKFTGIPIMLLLLTVVFWITITGANYPSALLSGILFRIQDKAAAFLLSIGAPKALCSILIFGVYRVLAWIVSVMLPPMAIFFPLFTLLEDLGYLPRIAFNMDNFFKKCHACGKQALTLCMGFGCNAAGIIGCRIIDSPRERLIAVITNNFAPCNGRFPTLITITAIFFSAHCVYVPASAVGALTLTAFVLLGIGATFIVSYILSQTLLKGEPSSFTLELPPYRRPGIIRIIVRSIFDRTVFVLSRAVITAIPAGLIIWIFANVSIGGTSILLHCSRFLDPFAGLMGLDGVILLAFILGIPANEIVIPIIIMAYTASGAITDLGSAELYDLFVSNGWTWTTAVSMMLFSLFHWPCATTLLTIKKETGSLKWTAVSFIIPTLIGILLCMAFTFIANLFI